MAPGKPAAKRGPKRKVDPAEAPAPKKARAPARKGPSKRAALNQCVQDNLGEIQQIQDELEQLAKERDALCGGEAVVLRLVS
ncbi:hypothetical protein SDRG_14848 [Saprolegnia diclina VS20]|uniref:BZIP domain-containing protein n=1 Tax=Saprolegnia diclina (strain VS20) TaxID=1156394 RepID=T0R5I7_SAPDV|nr:hypothetical protein SDRG_14848 [Saprolegnia diclina VS20]EQC27323.1 hypothetical protein SDRG_14848 [Saprolegnia diclina VS20]|eukprot:XP_008619227.1 hypothetical protein SDRG_14848 [Saprolegnia diclina VS20]